MIRSLPAALLMLAATAVEPAGANAQALSGMDTLLRAYPDQLAAIDGNFLVWRDGTKMPIADGLPPKNFPDLLRHGSLLDQMREHYPDAPDQPSAMPDDDPGRIRNRAFFDKMYGDCGRGEVAPHMVAVTWLPQNWGHAVMFTAVNGAAAHLAAVSQELDRLPAEATRFLHPLGGTYACRSVADTGERSMHAYGAAIDINVALSDYWLWERGAGPRHQTPPDIIHIFERHGFIWGGKWYHYDTMHFEYRPELLPPPD